MVILLQVYQEKGSELQHKIWEVYQIKWKICSLKNLIRK